MNQITFNNEIIKVVYNTHEEAINAKEWIFYNHELDYVEVEDTTLIFHYKGHRFLESILKDIFLKTSKGVSTPECSLIDKGTYIYSFYETITDDNNLFKVEVINKWGTKGISGFGIWQFGRILTFSEDKLTLRNSNLDDFRHELSFEEGLTVSIEIVEIISQ